MTSRRIAALAAAVAAIPTAGLVLAGAQTPGGASRVLEQPTGPPGIDRGVYVGSDVPEPRHRAARVQTADGTGDTPAPEREYLRHRVIVKFRGGGSATSRVSAASATGARAVRQPSYADFDVMDIDPSLDAEKTAAELASRPDVEYAQAAYIVHPRFRPNDPLYNLQWNLQTLGMEQAWDVNAGASTSAIVAVVDSGVAFQNASYTYTAASFVDEDGVRYPALGRVTIQFAAAMELAGPNRFAAPHDFIWNGDAPVDLDGHGTHVSGTIGQLTNNNVGVAGMAFNVRLMPVKVISGDWDRIFDAPERGTDDVVARGVRYAADNGARIINMSIGRAGLSAPVVASALRYAISRGAFIAVAAGNDYEQGNPIEAIAQEAAPLDGAIVVAAIGSDRRRVYYSSVHSYVEIAAPGGNSRVGGASGTVYQQTYEPTFTDTFLLPPSRYTAPRFDIFGVIPQQGTSMATPHVSGLAALLYTQGITDPAAIEAAIKRFATDLGTPGRDDEYGLGLINPRATLRGLGLLK